MNANRASNSQCYDLYCILSGHVVQNKDQELCFNPFTTLSHRVDTFIFYFLSYKTKFLIQTCFPEAPCTTR